MIMDRSAGSPGDNARCGCTEMHAVVVGDGMRPAVGAKASQLLHACWTGRTAVRSLADRLVLYVTGNRSSARGSGPAVYLNLASG